MGRIETAQAGFEAKLVSTADSFLGEWSWSRTSIQYRVKNGWSYISTPPYVFMLYI